MTRNRVHAVRLMDAFAEHVSGLGPWLFGEQRPTALDAHLVIFIARMLDLGRGEAVPEPLKAYAEAAFASAEYNAVMAGRRTLPGRREVEAR